MNKYYGRIWGILPNDFPTTILEKAYRSCINIIGKDAFATQLMGMGLAGTAYRFRMLAENDNIFTTSFKQDGCAPAIEKYQKNEASLYIFFSAGLSCIESFFFAMHALASHFKPDVFGLEVKRLKEVHPSQVKDQFKKCWKNIDLVVAMELLLKSSEFKEWKEIRNIFSHRAVIPRLIIFNCSNGQSSVNLQIDKTGSKIQNIALNKFTTTDRRTWLANQLKNLINALDLFIKRDNGVYSFLKY